MLVVPVKERTRSESRCKRACQSEQMRVPKIDEESVRNEQKSIQNRSWAVWGDPSRFGDAPRCCRDAPRTRKSASGTPPERSWDGPGASKSAPGTLQARQERSRTLREGSQDTRGSRSRRQTQSEAPADRFLTVFGLLRGSSDVRFVPLLPVFC